MISQLIRILLKWKYFILCFCFFSMIFTYKVTKGFLPKYYSEVVFIENESVQDNGYSVANSLISQKLGVSSKKTDKVNLILNLLESKRMLRDVVKQFDLNTKFNVATEQLAINELRRKIRLNYLQVRNKFVLNIFTSEANLSAEIANFFMKNLNKLNLELNLTSNKELVKVIDAAEPDLYPQINNPKKNSIVIFFVALLIAFFISTAFEFINKI
jgi:hypothetical protein